MGIRPLYLPLLSRCRSGNDRLRTLRWAEHDGHELPGVDRLGAHAEHDKADATAIEVTQGPQQVSASDRSIGLAGHTRRAD